METNIKVNSYQQQYNDLLIKLMESPHKVGDSRIGKINSRFAEQIRVDLSKEFPIMDIKWIKFSNVVHELLWMLDGGDHIKYLVDNDCHIWTDDAYRWYLERLEKHSDTLKKRKKFFDDQYDPSQLEIDFPPISKEFFGVEAKRNHPAMGFLGKIYGYQWRKFGGKVDQIQNVIDTLKSNPDDRRMIVTAHNPADIEDGTVGLPSCHNYFQFYTTINQNGGRTLHTFVNIRSNDIFLGQPYNVVQYALLTHMIAKQVGMNVGELVMNLVDAHLYHAHFEPAKIWLERFENLPTNDVVKEGITYLKNTYCKSSFILDGDYNSIDDYKPKDFVLDNYNPQPYIKAKLLT